jgi:single stranded DNA-binding protein
MTHAVVTLLGRAGRDAETRMTPTGKQIVSCSLAVGGGDKTTWFAVQAWEKTGDYLKDVKKGDLVYVSGGITAREYEGKMGKKTSLEINAQIVRTTTKRDSVPEYDAQSANMAVGQDFFDLDDSIPF